LRKNLKWKDGENGLKGDRVRVVKSERKKWIFQRDEIF
jgi:hypothetical protein